MGKKTNQDRNAKDQCLQFGVKELWRDSKR